MSRVGELRSLLHVETEDGNEGDGGDDVETELHVSLSRPVFLRAHQREGFKKAVRRLAASSAS